MEPIDNQDNALPRPLVLAAIAFGVVIRAVLLRGPLGGMDSDEAVSALVSRQARHGHFYALIPGFKAGGTLLAYPRAIVLMITGPNVDAAKWCEVAVFATACVVVWRIGRRLFSNRHGQIAGLLMWIYPAATVWDSTKVRLYYTVALLFVALGMLFAIRIHDRVEPRTLDLVAFGAIGGVCVWTHPMAMYAFVPTAIWLFIRRPQLLRRLPVMVPAAVAGALPWLWHNAHTSWGSLRQPLPAAHSTIRSRFAGFFRALLPRLTGLRHFYNGPWFLRPWSEIVYVALGTIAIVGLARWRGNRTLLTAVAIAYPFFFAIPRNSVFVAEPRYGVPFVPVLALCASALVVWVTRARLVAVVAVFSLAAVITGVSLQRVVDTSDSFAVNATVLRPVPTDPVWDAIANQHLSTVYADYWLAYRLVFEAKHDVLVIPLSNDYYGIGGRNQQGADVAFFYRDSACLAGWLEVVKGMGVSATSESLGDYVVVHTPQAIPVPVIAAAMSSRC